jgi:hypothetical protein
MIYLFDTNIVIYYFNGLTADQNYGDSLLNAPNTETQGEAETEGGWGQVLTYAFPVKRMGSGLDLFLRA